MIASTKVALALAEVLNKDPIASEALRHESGATINRSNLTGAKDSPFLQLNTRQIAWVVIQRSANIEDLSGDHYLIMLAVSALIAGDNEIKEALDAVLDMERILPWWPWAQSFTGTAETLGKDLRQFPDRRQGIAAYCHIAEGNRALVVPEFLMELADNANITAYHRLLKLGLEGPNRQALASQAHGIFKERPELLFAGDVDLLLAELIQVLPFDEATALARDFELALGDFSTVSLAERQIQSGLLDQAKHNLSTIRFLSPARERAARAMATAEIESGRTSEALPWIEEIDDEVTALRLLCRLFQDTGAHEKYLRSLAKLYTLTPLDPDVFTQLVLCLLRGGEIERAKRLCNECPVDVERYPQVAQVIQQVSSL